MPPLAERLGHKATDKLLIVNADDVGMSHAANAATIAGMQKGLISSGTIMVPCPWFEEIAAYARRDAVGRLRPPPHAYQPVEGLQVGTGGQQGGGQGLVTPEGYLWPDIKSVYKHATPEQAAIEARGQIRKATDAGIDITHLDSHMGALQYDMRYPRGLPRVGEGIRPADPDGQSGHPRELGGGHLRGELDADGTVYPDYLIHGERKSGEAVDAYWRRMLATLQPGVTELVHPPGRRRRRDAAHHQQLGGARHRVPPVHGGRQHPHAVEQQGVTVIGWRPLRDLQRKMTGR